MKRFHSNGGSASNPPKAKVAKLALKSVKQTYDNDSGPTLGTRSPSASGDVYLNIMDGIRAYIMEAGIGKVRSDIFRKQIRNLGGITKDVPDLNDVTHVVVDEKMDVGRLCRILKLANPIDISRVKVVNSLWLSECIKTKKLVDTQAFELNTDTNEIPSAAIFGSTSGNTIPVANIDWKPLDDNDSFTVSQSIKPVAKHIKGLTGSDNEESDYESSSNESNRNDWSAGEESHVEADNLNRQFPV